MNSEQSQLDSFELGRQERNGLTIGVVLALPLAVAIVYSFVAGGLDLLGSILPIFIASLFLIWAAATHRNNAGSVLLIVVVALQTIIAPLLERGLGISGAIGAFALISGAGLATLPRQHLGRIFGLALLVAITSIFIDLFASANRPLTSFPESRWAIAVAISLIFAFFLAREFFSLDVRTKIVLGILVTGGVGLAVLALFAVDRAGQMTNLLSGRLETGVRQLAEEELVNTVFIQADLVNQYFSDIATEVEDLAEYRVALQDQQQILGLGNYWDAHTQVFQLTTGQYANSADEISSVFVPVTTELDETVLSDLNTSAYLDLSAPDTLRANPAILAIYYIDHRGIVRYYPNVDLASLLPPDFDATQRPYYRITSPLFNPERITRWTIPYVDAAGGGLVVTAAYPIYFGSQFHGVVAADIQLSRVTERVSAISIGQTGYAFMIDEAGRIISMPPAGYAMFGVDPNLFPAEEFFKQSILGEGPEDLSSVARRMQAGGRGLNVIEVQGVDTYISYTPVESIGYSIALVVPVAEMQSAFITARNETQSQIRAATRLAAVIFTSLFVFAVLISIWLGSIIAAPILRLTQTANQIVGGDLSAQASIQSRDEIGTLAQAFNTMTARLRETLEGLEKRVEERTSDLLAANQKIERRARQFATISQISHVINQAQSLQDLLPQITQVISQQFNFYHVGVFLLDANNEYAVLTAANSEGGQRMLARNHKLKVGQVGIVGYVAGTSLPRIAFDTGADAAYFNNPDLPETHSEMALPLFSAGRQIVGVLDVQSVEVNAFGQEDIQVLSTLAEQVSVAIANAHLYEETQKALIEAEMVYRGELRTGWQKFTRALKLSGIRRKGTKSILLSEPVEVAGLDSVSRTGTIYEVRAENQQRGSQVTLPIKLRGEVVGVLNLRFDDNRELTPDELDIINAIVERAALSIENSRLLSESQKQAAKERIIGEIATKVSSFTNRENILQSAVTEIGRAMPGAEIIIQLDKRDRQVNQS